MLTALLKQNWMAPCSLIISALAFVLSYRRFKHDTRPKLILSAVPEGIEIENVGQVVAVNITLTLVERVKRPSGKLSVSHALRPGDKATVGASDWTDALTAELNRHTLEPMSEFVLRSSGRAVRPAGARVAFYLMAREKTTAILRFRAADGSKTFVRLISARRNQEGFPEFVPAWRPLGNRLSALMIERWYAKNAEIAPPSSLPRLEAGASDPTPESRLGK